jgi:SPX domain protein involved in polyphosphate accumulation
MKFGEYLRANAVMEWQDKYLNYDRLKNLIKILEEKHVGGQQSTGIGTSLTVPRPTNAAGMPVDQTVQVTQEDFFVFLESEMKKIEEFTRSQVLYFNSFSLYDSIISSYLWKGK